jgi:hypothetical protein
MSFVTRSLAGSPYHEASLRRPYAHMVPRRRGAVTTNGREGAGIEGADEGPLGAPPPEDRTDPYVPVDVDL